jgi:phosphoglycerol transferase MdoB-like AlkP superfamily enzyme
MKSLASRIATLPFLHHAGLFLAVAGLTRLALALAAGPDKIPLPLWPGLLLRGIGFDLAVLAWILAPMLLWAALWPVRWRDTRWQGGVRLAIFCLMTAVLLFGALAEGVFWEEFDTRFNFIAVDYLVYTHEVIGNIVESYPVGALLAGVAALAALLTWLLRAPIRAVRGPARAGGWRVAYAVLALALPWGAWHLADVDQMRFSGNAYANELAGNGLMTFMAAFLRNELDYERFYATLPPAQAQHILGELGVEREPLSRALHPDPDEAEGFDPQRLPFKRPPRNVVLISVESLSARFLGSFGNPEGLTPRLDGLARDGLLFTHLYATGTRTVRGLEALSLGTPPIPGQAIVRRPGNEHLATLGEILRRQGYGDAFPVRRLRLFRQHECLFRRQRLSRRRPHGFPQGVRRLRERLGGGRRVPVRQQPRAARPGLRRRQALPRADHDHLQPPPLHLPGWPHRHRLAGKARRRGEIHRLRDRPLHRPGARETVV